MAAPMPSLPPSRYVDVRYPDGRLAFRFDVGRGVVQIGQRGEIYYFDLVDLVKRAEDLPIAKNSEPC